MWRCSSARVVVSHFGFQVEPREDDELNQLMAGHGYGFARAKEIHSASEAGVIECRPTFGMEDIETANLKWKPSKCSCVGTWSRNPHSNGP